MGDGGGYVAYILLYIMIRSLRTSSFYVFAMKCPSFPRHNIF